MDYNLTVIILFYLLFGFLLLFNGANLVRSFISFVAFLFGFFVTLNLLNINLYDFLKFNKSFTEILLSIWLPILIGLICYFVSKFFVRFFISLANANLIYYLINFIGKSFIFDFELLFFVSLILSIIFFLYALFNDKFYKMILILNTSLWGSFFISYSLIILFISVYDIYYLKLLDNYIVINTIHVIEYKYKVLFYIIWVLFFIIGLRIQNRN